MTRKKKTRSGTVNPLQVNPGAVKQPAENTFEFWNQENMREARPISIEVDRPEGGSADSEEK